MNRGCERRLWTAAVNGGCRPRLWTAAIDRGCRPRLWTAAIDRGCEPRLWTAAGDLDEKKLFRHSVFWYFCWGGGSIYGQSIGKFIDLFFNGSSLYSATSRVSLNAKYQSPCTRNSRSYSTQRRFFPQISIIHVLLLECNQFTTYSDKYISEFIKDRFFSNFFGKDFNDYD